MVVFTLTIIDVNTWQGHGSDKSTGYISGRRNAAVPTEVLEKTFTYNFGDGWTAAVFVHKMNCREAKALIKKSAGFMGYDWMVDSIIEYGRIVHDRCLRSD